MIQILKLLVLHACTLPDEVASQKASGPMRAVSRTEDDRPILTVVNFGISVAAVAQSVILGCGLYY
jgi:hypothetical protein